jgi:hypothetical protein
MKEIRYTPEDAQKEADKIREIVGEKASTEDYAAANQLTEDEKERDRKGWLEHFNKGYITIFPSESDKHVMIGINTNNGNIFKLFNAAAREVTPKYRGFHQMGSSNPIGETAWELWDLPQSVHPTDVVDEIYKKMLELEPKYKKFGFLDEEDK